MKKSTNQTKNIVAAVLLCAAATSVNAQDTKTETFEPRKMGFGLKFSMLGMEDLGLTSPMAGGKTFFLSINATKNFRIEPEFAFARASSKGINLSEDLVSKGSRMGGSLFYMFQKGNANFYAGPNVSMGSFTSQQEVSTFTSSGTLVYSKEETHYKNLAIGAIVGTEYFFNPHFSLGGELGFFTHKLTTEYPSSYPSPTTRESNATYTTGNLVFRAYF